MVPLQRPSEEFIDGTVVGHLHSSRALARRSRPGCLDTLAVGRFARLCRSVCHRSPRCPSPGRACSHAFERHHPGRCNSRLLRARCPAPNLTGLRYLLGLPKRPSGGSARRAPPAPTHDGRGSRDPYWKSGASRREYHRPRRVAGHPTGDRNDPRHDLRAGGRFPFMGTEYTVVLCPRS